MNYWDGTTGDTALMILRIEVDFLVLRLFVKWTGRPAFCMAGQPLLHESNLVGMKVTLSPKK
jgi:hypothetical protein